MPFALIPDGYSLKKVTKLQKQAVSDKRRHDNVMKLLENPTTLPTLATLIGGALIAKTVDDTLQGLVDEGINIVDQTKNAVKANVVNKPLPISVFFPASAGLDLAQRSGLLTAEQEQQIRDAIPFI
jgi:hypothetical protein